MDFKLKVKSHSVIHEVIADEAVVMNLDTGLYFSFNVTGTDIWKMIVEGNAGEKQIREFSGPKNQLFCDFIINQGLAVREMLDDSATKNSRDFAPVSGLAEYQVFSDMEDLLLLDPVHDVALGENGWPESRGRA